MLLEGLISLWNWPFTYHNMISWIFWKVTCIWLVEGYPKYPEQWKMTRKNEKFQWEWQSEVHKHHIFSFRSGGLISSGIRLWEPEVPWSLSSPRATCLFIPFDHISQVVAFTYSKGLIFFSSVHEHSSMYHNQPVIIAWAIIWCIEEIQLILI